MYNFISLLFRAYDKILAGLVAVIGGLSIVILLLISLQVFSRYLAKSPVLWTTDASVMLMLGMGLPGAAWLLRNDEHVQIDVVVNYLSEKKKLFLNLITSVLGVLTCIAITVSGLWVTHDQYTRGVKTVGDLQIPKFILVALIPLGTFFLAIEFIRKVKYYYGKLKEKN